MITREEAAALLAERPGARWEYEPEGGMVMVVGQNEAIALVLDHEAPTAAADAHLLTAAPDLARTVVALYDDLAAAQDRSDVEQEALRMATLELRRLRAAEAPGTDDEAVAPWASIGDPRYWIHPSRVTLRAENEGWRFYAPGAAGWSDVHAVALDAMRAAVPGSV